jgi:hypothetical protein
MFKIVSTIYLVCLCSLMSGQQTTTTTFECIPEKDTLRYPGVYSIVDTMPRFPGGEGEFLKYFAENTLMPNDGVSVPQSTYRLQFIVDENGLITRPVVNEKKVDKLTPQELEILRVVKNMPPWNPGKCNGQVVSVRVRWPITLCLSRF